MRRLYFFSLLLVGCGDSASGTTKPDASIAVDADQVDAPDPEVVTFPPANLADDAVAAKKWAVASAPQLYSLAITPVLLAEAELQIGEETCPVKTENAGTTTYTGGCTSMEGNPWTGTATQTAATRAIEYQDFGGTGTSTCNETEYPSTFKYNGTITPSATDPNAAVIAVTGEIVGPDETNNCQPRTGTFAIDYTLQFRQGTHDADGDGSPDDTFWSGSGRYGDSADGAVDAMTTDEQLEEDVCSDEALAGETKVTSEGHTITITYDGATDCDVESTVRWAYDGTDRGELVDVSCSAGGSSGSTLVLFVVAGIVVRRRRSRRS